MDEFTHGGTPPTLWLDRDYHRHITHHMDIGSKSSQYKLRIRRLADQVEKLSWMLEYMDEDTDFNHCTMKEAEEAWKWLPANRS